MFSNFPYLTFLAGILCLGLSPQLQALGQYETKVPATVFNGDTIPSPPAQTAVWKPPATSLPEKFVTATVTLFDQGLADPRDCEYRQIEVVVGSVWGGHGVCKIHGWVLPNKSPDQTQRFGIGWNGLVYPLVSVGEPANLNEDIQKLIKQDEDFRARWKIEHPDFPFHRFHSGIHESASTSHEVLLPLKAALLLRLGHADLAEKVWSAWTVGTNLAGNDQTNLKDPYLILASEWAWALFDRAVTTHMRGDDRLSVLSARSLLAIETSVEAEIERRNIIHQGHTYASPGRRTRYLTFLEPLTQLLADEERRVREEANPRRQALEEDLRIKDPRARVDALIRHLDEVVVFQRSQPGGVDLRASEIVQALIAQGDAAVDPLLNVIENDIRLTRSVSFSRDFHVNRHLIGVHEVAYAALVEILKTSNFAFGSEWDTTRQGRLDERRAVVAQIRRYLKEYGGLSLEERWYRILSNDHASADQWLEAAGFIVQRADYNDLPPSWVFTELRAPKPGEAFQLRGESLRRKTNPTISELLIRRMRELAQRAAHENWHVAMQQAVSLALALGTWDGPAHISELQRLMAALVEQYANARGTDASKRHYLIGHIVSLTLKRSELEDKQALAQYAAWLRTVRPADTEYATTLLFEPAVRYSNAPEVAGAIGWMFLDVSSPWVPLVPRKVDYYNINTAELMEKLMNFPAFREQILKNLEDKSVVATLVPRPASPNDKYDLKIENNIAAVVAGSPNSSAIVVSIAHSDTKAPRPPLQPVSFRVRDVYAWKLRGYEGAPRIELYWTEAERDAAVADFVTFLREHEGKFVYSPERAYRYTQ
ncbi:MAG TPA: hypothetical protein VFH31_17395 [Pyrinomonadaceae bacterium]|nr:hypothetical protein [Pyrinomonadaceae bacterium]